jgi:hypothetical protein
MFGFIKNKVEAQQINVLSNEIDGIIYNLFKEDNNLFTAQSFFNEIYVQGFLLGYSSAIMNVRFDGLSWPKDKRGGFQLKIMRTIYGGNAQNLTRMLLDLDYSRQMSENLVFTKGKDEGYLAALLVHKKIDDSYPEPLVEEAKSFALQAGTSLDVSILMLTIGSFKIDWQKQDENQTRKLKTDTIPCPICDEDIKAQAKKCKHCGEWLNDNEDIQL